MARRKTLKLTNQDREKIRKYIDEKIGATSHRRFSQEPNYTAGAFRALEGEVPLRNGSIRFESTIVNDRGRNSAESKFGADFAIVVKIETPIWNQDKGILGQSKKGRIDRLDADARAGLRAQIGKMKKVTRSPIIFETPDGESVTTPSVVSANRVRKGEKYKRRSFAGYVISRVLPCLDGDSRQEFIQGVSDSALTRLDLALRTQ